MKKIIMSAVILLGITGAVEAQTADGVGIGSSHRAGDNVSKKGPMTKNQKMLKLNQRKMYVSPKTGQLATPTGQQATAINGAEAPYPKSAQKRHGGQ